MSIWQRFDNFSLKCQYIWNSVIRTRRYNGGGGGGSRRLYISIYKKILWGICSISVGCWRMLSLLWTIQFLFLMWWDFLHKKDWRHVLEEFHLSLKYRRHFHWTFNSRTMTSCMLTVLQPSSVLAQSCPWPRSTSSIWSLRQPPPTTLAAPRRPTCERRCYKRIVKSL